MPNMRSSTSEFPSPTDEHRIVVEHRGTIVTIEYIGTNPDTRYLPRPRTRLKRILDRISIGVHGPDHMTSFGR